MYKQKCPKCKGKAHFVAGYTPADIRLEQYHCDDCGYTWVETSGGRFVREGVLCDPVWY